MKSSQAQDWFRRFHERAPGRSRHVKLPQSRAVAMIGTLDAVPYTAIVNGRAVRFKHTFAKGSRPMLATDGRHLYILGGRFRVTERGIVDLSPRGRERD
jgi:hypothetical protein